MTFLQLINALRQRCGIIGADLTRLANLSGEDKRCSNWISDAWMEIQAKHTNWKFLQTSFSFTTTASQQSYTPAQAGVTDLGNWKTDSFRIYQTSIGTNNEIWMSEWDYDTFRNLYQFGAQRGVYARPVVFAIDPSKNILLGPGPNATGYTVLGQYFKVPSALSADSDTPSAPSQFHLAIVGKAMQKYGKYEAAPEILKEGEDLYKLWMTQLENDQLPKIDFGGPLA